MAIPRLVVNRPTTILVIFALAVGFGLYTAANVAIDLFPEVNPPVLLVFSNYSGAGPEEVEKTVTRPLESQLSNVSNIETITSTSSEGTSQLQLEFTYGTDMTEAANEVRDSLEFVKGILPDEATTPQIFKFDPSLIPILQLKVSGERSPEDLRELAEDIVQPRIEQIDGVALAGVTGGRRRVVRVEIPQNRMEAYGLNFQQLEGVMRGNNLQISAGNITQGSFRYLVRTAGEFKQLGEIRDTVVTYRGSPPGPQNPGSRMVPVRLKDIAEVYNGFAEQTSAVYINGEPGVFVTVQKQSGTNSVEVADTVIERLDGINRALPMDVSVGVLVNTTTIIKESLEQVSTSAILGAILAVVILFLFLRSLRTTTVIAVAIPVSLVLTFMLMYFFDLTLNLMTLTGLALGVGMLVDNSIVILENIYRYREKGAKLHASAILGSQEMLTAITASTLTTISVFLPVAVFGDQLDFVGELFAGLAFTVVISLASSLVVAAVLIPVLASKYVPLVSRSEKPLRGLLGALDRGMGAGFTALDNAYKRALRVVLRHRVITIVIVLAAFGATMTLVPQLGFELVPSQNNDAVQVDVTLPAGSTFSETEEVMQEFAAIARDEIAAYEDIVIQVGQPAVFGFLGAAETHRGTLTVTLPPFEERLDSSQEVEAKLRRYFNDFPGTEFGFQQQSFLGGANPVSITIRTEDLEYGRSVGERIAALLRDRFPEVTEPSLALAEGKPQLEVQVDRPRAYALGLDMATIGRELRANINGVTAGKYRSGGNEYDILLILDEEDRDALPDLQRIFVNNRFGQAIPLSSFASFERSTGPVNISRENQSRVLRVTGGLQPGSDLADVVPRIRRAIAEEIPAREGLSIEFSGDYEDLLDYGTTFVIIIVISVLLVFGVMASQFESFVDPFIIFFTIPLTFIGVVLLYAATGEILSLFTAVGLVVLVGIVVNNGIVLVDYTNLMRKRGLSLVEACIEAGGNRLRPILMTTLTTVLGLIPVAFMVGEGGSLIQPIAKTVVGGLSVATIFTLFLIPVVYAIVNSFSERRKIRDAENPVTLAQYGGASAGAGSEASEAFDSSDKGEQQ